MPTSGEPASTISRSVSGAEIALLTILSLTVHHAARSKLSATVRKGLLTEEILRLHTNAIDALKLS